MTAIVAGCFGILAVTIMRFFYYSGRPMALREKLLKMFFFTDVRQKNIETLETLLEIASIQWIGFGLFYVFVIQNLTISPIYNKAILYIALYAPLLSIVVLGRYLKQKYWDLQE